MKTKAEWIAQNTAQADDAPRHNAGATERYCVIHDTWFRVEVTDHEGQVVAIEPEMLAGRDIGTREQKVIERAIDHLCGFLGKAKP